MKETIGTIIPLWVVIILIVGPIVGICVIPHIVNLMK